MDTMFLSEALEHYSAILYTRIRIAMHIGKTTRDPESLIACENAIKHVQTLEMEEVDLTAEKLGSYLSIVREAVDSYYMSIEASFMVAKETMRELAPIREKLSLVRN